LPSTSRWTTYSTIVVPPVGTENLRLFLYSDGPTGTPLTDNDYANVRVYGLNTAGDLAVLARPAASQDPPLVADSVSYSAYWDGPSDSTHVLVDGLVNGWIGSRQHDGSRPRYALAGIVIGVEVATGVACCGFVTVVLAGTLLRRYRRIRGAGRRDPS
jgi:hypothetical protein